MGTQRKPKRVDPQTVRVTVPSTTVKDDKGAESQEKYTGPACGFQFEDGVCLQVVDMDPTSVERANLENVCNIKGAAFEIIEAAPEPEVVEEDEDSEKGEGDGESESDSPDSDPEKSDESEGGENAPSAEGGEGPDPA